MACHLRLVDVKTTHLGLSGKRCKSLSRCSTLVAVIVQGLQENYSANFQQETTTAADRTEVLQFLEWFLQGSQNRQTYAFNYSQVDV